MSDDLIKRSDAIASLGEEPYVWIGYDEFAQGERSQWIDDVSAIKAVPPADRPQGEWTPCSKKLPEACQNVQLTCEVRPVGREPSRYVCIAQWIPRFCQEALSVNWDAEVTEYCEEDDEYYPLEGWYERIRNWDDYSLVGIADFAIAWKPLEEPYKGAKE